MVAFGARVPVRGVVSLSGFMGPEDLERIEKRMGEIVKANTPFVRSEIARDEALQTFSAKGECYKAELVEAIRTARTEAYTYSYEQAQQLLAERDGAPDDSRARHG